MFAHPRYVFRLLLTYLVRTHIHQVSKTSTPKKGPSPKKKRKSNHDGDASELSVIPSSQSDERELVVPKTSQKDLQEVQASVLAWQELSQQEEQIEFEPGWGNMDMDISASVSYSRMQVSPQPSMVPPQPPTPISSPLSSVSCGKSPLASWQRTPCASPTKNRLSVVVPSLTQRKPVVSTNIVASPRIPSTTSSLTKVSSSPILLEKKEEAIAESSKPESPRILTEDAKTKALIESIKAKALRNVSPASEDSEKVYEALGELVESDDDLDFDFDWYVQCEQLVGCVTYINAHQLRIDFKREKVQISNSKVPEIRFACQW